MLAGVVALAVMVAFALPAGVAVIGAGIATYSFFSKPSADHTNTKHLQPTITLGAAALS